MPRATRSQGHSSTAPRSSFDSDFTDLYEVEGSPKRSKTTRRVNNTDTGEGSDSELSSEFSAARHDRCDVCEEDDEMDSEEDARTYSAYHGSDSEVPDPKPKTKQTQRIKKGPIVEPTTSKENGVGSVLHSDTVMLVISSCLLLEDSQILRRKGILRCRMPLQ